MKTNHLQKNIPTGWKQVTLGDLFDFKNGLNSEKENFGHGMRFINIMEILKHDYLVAKNIPGRINVDEKRSKDNIVEYGDVLFNRTSETPDEVGMTSVYLDTEPVVFGGFVIRAKPKTKDLQVFAGGAKKGDWDVGLAVDAIKMAPRLDAVIIASGDGDYIPLVEYLQTMTQVEVISFGKSTSMKLKEKISPFLLPLLNFLHTWYYANIGIIAACSKKVRWK
jgi:uncharacterized LabA/DUF88 family protein